MAAIPIHEERAASDTQLLGSTKLFKIVLSESRMNLLKPFKTSDDNNSKE